MKTFNTFAELALAKISTGTPVRILKPALIDGVVENSGEGLTLLSGNVFVPQFNDQEALTGRKTSILDDNFSSGFNAFINVYIKNDEGEWEGSAGGRTSAVYYNGQLWWPLQDIPYVSGGYQITSWSQPTANINILEVVVTGGSVIQFDRFTGVVGGDSGGSIVSETPPNNPVAGTRWTRCDDMKSFLWYVDSDGAQWIEDNPSYGAPTVPYNYVTFSEQAFVQNTSTGLGGNLTYHITRTGKLVNLTIEVDSTGITPSTAMGSSDTTLPAWAVPVTSTYQVSSLDSVNDLMYEVIIIPTESNAYVSLKCYTSNAGITEVQMGQSNTVLNISYIGQGV